MTQYTFQVVVQIDEHDASDPWGTATISSEAGEIKTVEIYAHPDRISGACGLGGAILNAVAEDMFSSEKESCSS